ncbi:two-component system sensor histidine kinase NtrB [Halobaculum rubrum]|uniref:two-component system sensor histidine kinase NtrB n=1 Tax=Halobaculum rubrum TaxID=2872158 RepID=UPI001CA3B7CF|nr:PAS domain-containing sensor histidine kinase [Halobaculum rubrum]QZX98773.1 PAS domain-containing sensor histidine kinase [Halobaculum rubrum]
MDSGSPVDLSPEFLAEMVESVGVGVGIYGRDGRYIYVNQSYADLFDVPPEELVGKTLWEITPEIEASRFDSYWDSFDDDETRTAETVHKYNDREIPVATVTTQRSIDGTPYHFGTIKEISERRAREREIMRQNERLESFASVVSHDLRNPLNVAQGYLDVLREDISRDELRLVDNALDRMDVLITELLELAQSDSEVGETAPVSIPAVAEEAWRNVDTPEAVLHAPDGDPRVVADETRLQQLFENLFRNAVEHAGSDAHVTIDTVSDGFYVADDGPGIPQDKRERVFETGYTTTDRGTGFGLSIVQQIVTGHHWSIQVTEQPDGGARFEITGVEFSTE